MSEESSLDTEYVWGKFFLYRTCLGEILWIQNLSGESSLETDNVCGKFLADI